MPHSTPTIAVIGGGPAGLTAAETLICGGAAVTVYERMPSLGRKFLMAGRGGLNLTHSEDLERLLGRYGTAATNLRPAIEAFPPAELRAWCESLGQPTFVGSSARVFPKAMKASPLLRAWLRRLAEAGATFKLRHPWEGWNEAGQLLFATPDGQTAVSADATILALGGASWPRLGSDGGWVSHLRDIDIEITPLQAANCGVLVDWSEVFRHRFAGHPLKRLQLAIAGQTERGEAVITRSGLEGGGIYALSAAMRAAVAADRQATLHLDLRPDSTPEALRQRLQAPRGKQSLATFLRKAVNLAPAEIGLLHETAMAMPGRLAGQSPEAVADLIKAVPIHITGMAPLARAISTAGGIQFGEVDAACMLRRKPGVFVAGEMLDWEAPTGGYLLQACFATGRAAAKGALSWVFRPW